MTDLTPIFHKCVNIVSCEYPVQLPKDSRSNRDNSPYEVVDLFTKDCQEVYNNLIRLSAFVAQIKPLYLQNNDDYSRYERETRRLTAVEKNGIDEEFRLKVHEINEKIKMFRSYEAKRNELFESLNRKSGFMLSIFVTDLEDESIIYNKTLTMHRAQVLLFLNNTIYKCNAAFEKMQRQRYERERQLNVLDFQNLDDSDDLDMPNNFKSDYKMEVIDQEQPVDVYRATDTIPQELLQELTQENQELLLSKQNQLKEVEKLRTSMVDIVNLQAELTLHLESQGEQIGNLIEDQERVELDLKEGNRTLTKATYRNKRGTNVIVTTCIVLGLLLLFVDYIS